METRLSHGPFKMLSLPSFTRDVFKLDYSIRYVVLPIIILNS